MEKPVSPLTLQFLAWLTDQPRSYADVMDAWRSNCPRHSVWEDAVIDGLVKFQNGSRGTVVLTSAGHALLGRGTEPRPGRFRAERAETSLASAPRSAIFQPSDEDVS